MEGYRVAGEKPVGGFVPIKVGQLVLVWCCYESGIIKLIDLRVWFALHELRMRRCCMQAEKRARYSIAEIMSLTGQSRRSNVVSAIGRLQESGLVKCSRSSIEFAKSLGETVVERTGVEERLKLIVNHRRKVPVPRTVIRFVAAGARRVLIATIIGHLLRLLYLRDGQCRADGNCKASWIATVFNVNLRSVKQGRRTLIAAGLLTTQEKPQWYANRYGWRGAFNLGWKSVDNSDSPAPHDSKPPPLRHRLCRKPSPPLENQYLSTRNKNKKPVSREFGSLKRTGFGAIAESKMRSNEVMGRVFDSAVQRGAIGRNEEMNFFAAIEHALRVGIQNPPGLFVWLIKNRKWDYVTQADEDVARSRLLRMQSDVRLKRKIPARSRMWKTSDLVGTCIGMISRNRHSFEAS